MRKHINNSSPDTNHTIDLNEVRKQAKGNVNRKSKQNLFYRRVLLLLFLVILAFISWRAIQSLVCRFCVDVIPVQHKIVEDVLNAEFLVLRDESLISAPASGRLELNYSEGERVGKNAIVGYIIKTTGTSLQKEEKIPIRAQQTGILSFHIDGFENLCRPETWAQVDTKLFADLEKKLTEKAAINGENNSIVNKGDNLFKITDNLSPCYLYWKAAGIYPDEWKKDVLLSIKLHEFNSDKIAGRITEFTKDDEAANILIKISGRKGMEKYRRIRGEIVVEKNRGTVVAKSVLVLRQGVPGVYLVKKGRAAWQKVKIIEYLEDSILIEGLRLGQQLITTPRLVEEGQRILVY